MAQADCLITMAYKEGAKMPLIAKSPDNSGAYLELFSRASQEIGCVLKVQRYPKKRLHIMLGEGNLDFYPGASFSNERAKYLYYIPNGFETAEYAITSLEVLKIKDYADIKAKKLVWFMELGSSKKELARKYGITINQTGTVDIDKARKMIILGRAAIIAQDKEPVDYYLKKNKLTSYESIGLKIHKDLFGGLQPMYMGFSRSSPHFKESPNPNHDPNQPISPDNFPTIIDSSCVAFKLGKALKGLSDSGETSKIYNRYFFEK